MIRPARPLALKGLLGDVIKELRAADLGRKKEGRKDGKSERRANTRSANMRLRDHRSQEKLRERDQTKEGEGVIHRCTRAFSLLFVS